LATGDVAVSVGPMEENDHVPESKAENADDEERGPDDQ
jgi:hypothetical protein